MRIDTAAGFQGRAVTLGVAAALLCSVPVALAAPKAGSYKGSSKGKIEVRVPDPELGVAFKMQTDTGKVSFKVKGRNLTLFSIRGQKAMCGASPVDVDFKIAKIKLTAKGSGKATATHPNVGPMKLTIKVGSTGKASGTITFGGLCRGKATFTARRS